MRIYTAEEFEFSDVRAFYHTLIDAMKNSPYNIGWKKDVYPSIDFLKDSIKKRELFIGKEDDVIIGAMVLNHACNPGYREFEWKTKAAENEISVIHALGIHPDFAGRGCAKQFVAFALKKAEDHHQKAVRLDVLKGNLPAERLYTGLGFQKVHTLKMYYEDTGWTDYELFEYVLPS